MVSVDLHYYPLTTNTWLVRDHQRRDHATQELVASPTPCDGAVHAVHVGYHAWPVLVLMP